MHLLTNKNNISQYKKQFNSNSFAAANTHPQIHFTASFQKLIDSSKNITYTQIDKITQAIDGVYGQDKFFSRAIQDAGLNITDNKLVLQNESFLKSFLKTVKYPFLDMPRDIANWVLRGAQKTPLKGVAQSIANTKILKSRAQQVTTEKNLEIVSELLDRFTKTTPQNNSYDIDKCVKGFKSDAAFDITTMAKNYNSRDERTLNRIATSLVSATFSARDFYNISMLQKDNKEEAKEAKKGRFKQELARMAITAALTFVNLGALEKFVSKNIYANAAVIAMSALISEVVSRIISKTPLIPLTSEQAAKIGEKKEKEEKELEQNSEIEKSDDIQDDDDTEENDNQIKTLSLKPSNENKKIFVEFMSKDGTFASVQEMKKQINKNKEDNTNKNGKKKIDFGKAAGLLSLGASLYYILAQFKKGTFSSGMEKRNFYLNHKTAMDAFVNPDNTNSASKTLQEGIEKIYTRKHGARQGKLHTLLHQFKGFITNKKTDVDLRDFREQIVNLKATKEGAEIEELLDEYIRKIDIASIKSNTMTSSKPRLLLSGLYDGITKIFKMMYQILSLPGMLATNIINKTLFKSSNQAFDMAAEKLNITIDKNFNEKCEKQLGTLNEIFVKYAGDPDANRKIVENIKSNTRSYSSKVETGELASISRTLVTLISSYFFVNDYRNKVLIESKGKDVEKAREEKNSRIMHKLSNFIINGTLMNVFNSVFKTPLNNSLAAATIIAAATEFTNETLVRKSICQPIKEMDSRDEIIEYEEKQLNKKGPMGIWSRGFMKLTGKKSLTQKADIKTENNKK